MKKLVFFLLAVVFAASGCKEEKPSKYVLLGDYTAYTSYHEKINGKVEKLTEKLYWPNPVGNTYTKGNLITKKERDSLNWFYDYEVTYDEAGDIKTCLYLDDSGRVVWKWEFVKQNNVLTSARRTNLDTLRVIQRFKCNSNGDIIEASRFRMPVDTMFSWFTFYYSMKGDTEIYQNYNYRSVQTAKSIRVLDEYGQYLKVANYNGDGIYNTGHDIKYNENGYQVGNINYDKDKNITADWDMMPLEFDEKGNWIMRIFSRDKDVLCIAERTITYFE